MNEYDKIENYNWHDCPLYAVRFDDELQLDIDYIVEWRELRDLSFEFLIAPAKLVFFEVENFEFKVEAELLNGFEINKITQQQDLWTIELQEGLIKFKSKGFKQSLLKEPIWVKNQHLSEEERKII